MVSVMVFKILIDSSTELLKARAFIKYSIVYDVVNTSRHPLVYEEILRTAKKYREVYSLSSLREHPMVRMYRSYLWRLGIDPTKKRPSHEALIRRVVRSGSMPLVNTVVDIGNLVSVKYFVPVGIYDLDKLKPPVKIRASVEGELFYPIGSSEPVELPNRYPVLSDREKIIHIFPYRDSVYSMVTIDTENILIVVGGVEGVPVSTVSKALDEIVRFVSLCSSGENRVVDGEVIWFGGT